MEYHKLTQATEVRSACASKSQPFILSIFEITAAQRFDCSQRCCTTHQIPSKMKLTVVAELHLKSQKVELAKRNFAEQQAFHGLRV